MQQIVAITCLPTQLFAGKLYSIVESYVLFVPALVEKLLVPKGLTDEDQTILFRNLGHFCNSSVSTIRHGGKQ